MNDHLEIGPDLTLNLQFTPTSTPSTCASWGIVAMFSEDLRLRTASVSFHRWFIYMCSFSIITYLDRRHILYSR